MSTNAGRRWGEINPNWSKLKSYQKRRWPDVVEPSKRPKWPAPKTRVIPYHHWESGLLVWDTSEGPWGHCPSIECPEFPDVLDEDIFQLLHVIGFQRGMLCGPNIDLYRWAIVSASKRAIDELDG